MLGVIRGLVEVGLVVITSTTVLERSLIVGAAVAYTRLIVSSPQQVLDLEGWVLTRTANIGSVVLRVLRCGDRSADALQVTAPHHVAVQLRRFALLHTRLLVARIEKAIAAPS